MTRHPAILNFHYIITVGVIFDFKTVEIERGREKYSRAMHRDLYLLGMV